MSRSTLSCCIVIKNEEQRIINCLNHIMILADEIVIVDTGSTDKTISFIKKWILIHKASKGVKLISVGNKFHDSDGDFDFGAAKTFAIKNATKDFVMWIDANDVVTDQKKAKKYFLTITNKNKNVYFSFPTAVSTKFAFPRIRIGPRKTSFISGRIHEYMTFSNIKKLKKVFLPITIKNIKEKRDLNRNLRILLKEWKKKETSRTAFYIALTYNEMHKSKEALLWFKKRVYNFKFINEFKEEYFKSLEMIAELILKSFIGNVYSGDLFDVSLQMIEKDPARPEGYYYAAKYYNNAGEYTKSFDCIKKCLKCKNPTNYKLWLNMQIYNGKGIQELLDQCRAGLNNKGVLKPESITDYANYTKNRNIIL